MPRWAWIALIGVSTLGFVVLSLHPARDDDESDDLGRIADDHGDRTTAKKLAQDLLMDGLALKRGYWDEGTMEDSYGRMTERERDEVNQQLKKQADRCAKIFGYPESWSA